MRFRLNFFKTVNRNYSIKRKYPIDPNHASEIPISKYTLPQARNRVYVWGNARTGALGTPQLKHKENSQYIEYLQCPKRLHFAEKNEVTSLAAGFGFTIFAVNSQETKLFGTGLNTDSQIGYHEVRTDKPLGVIFMPQPIFLPIQKDTKVLKVAAGRAHAAALTEEGLFMLGNNSYGQCGREIVSNEDYSKNKSLQCISDIDGLKIVDVECGQDHTLVLLENGTVYSCGWGADGQTGLGHYNVEYKFSKVNGDIKDETIVKLACRSDFVMALNEKGEVFGWGNTEYNQITLPDGSQQICNPTAIEMLQRLGPIKDVASGGSFCSVLNKNGHVFVWGFGLLGTGPEVQESKSPIPIPPQLFGYNDFNPDCEVESINCGLSHFGAVTNKGDLYTWGRNRSSCLGLGHKKDQYFPLKVALGASVKRVFCGLDHTVTLCESYLTEK